MRGCAGGRACRVTSDGLWALGDVTGVALFTHVAMYQARVVADTILGTPRRADYTGIPRVVFAHPEIAAVGMTTDTARTARIDVIGAEVDLAEAIARPWTYQTHPVGTLGVLADRDQRILVGAWAVAPLAGNGSTPRLWGRACLHPDRHPAGHRGPIPHLHRGIPRRPRTPPAVTRLAGVILIAKKCAIATAMAALSPGLSEPRSQPRASSLAA